MGSWLLAELPWRAGTAIFQCCLIISAWLKFSPDYIDPNAYPPVIDHFEAASTMTTILGAGILYFCYVSIRWTRGTSKLKGMVSLACLAYNPHTPNVNAGDVNMQ